MSQAPPLPPLHAIHPSWILSPSLDKESRADKAQIEPWLPLQSLVAAMSDVFSVEIVVINHNAICVSGTGPYKKGVGLTVPADTALAHSLSARKCVLVHNPRENVVCQECSLREDCRDQANYSGPVTASGQVVAAIQIVAFDTAQRSALLERAEAAFSVVRQIVELLFQERKMPGASAEAGRSGNGFYGLMGNSPLMLQLRQRIQKAATSDGVVLITGETGTGKELTARAIHAESGRKGPFIPVNCGALPEQLAESELFGYAKGAFSGADPGGHSGLWEAAAGGTLFLDEVGELSHSLQVKLLRALQDGGIRRVGDSVVRTYDTRIIAATNLSLTDKVKDGSFRQDLYYRLKVIPICLPTLRERPEDIGLLANFFLQQCCTRHAGRMVVIGPELMQHFLAYSWPGNVRELENCIEYGAITCEGTAITWEILSDYFDHNKASRSHGDTTGSLAKKEVSLQGGKNARSTKVNNHFARQMLAQCEEEAKLQGNSTGETKKEAARRLGISLATLYRLLKKDA